jgi:hypothetical protein
MCGLLRGSDPRDGVLCCLRETWVERLRTISRSNHLMLFVVCMLNISSVVIVRRYALRMCLL